MNAVPIAIPTIKTAISLTSGGGFSCAILVDGSLRCWGSNDQGELGQGNQDALFDVLEPGAVTGSTPLSNVRAVGAGTSHVCASTDDGIYCWGYNDAAQVGNGALDGVSVTTPAMVTPTDGLTDVLQIGASDEVSCALTKAGAVYCWGDADHVGNGGTCSVGTAAGKQCLPPTLVIPSGVRETAFVAYAVFARLDSGEVMGWGDYENIGNGMPAGGIQTKPTMVTGFP